MSIAHYQKKKQVFETFTIIVGFFVFIGFLMSIANPFIMIIVIVFTGLIGLIITKAFKDLSNAYKIEHVKKTIEALVPHSNYDPIRGFTSEFVFQSKIVDKKSTFRSEDYLSGTINGKQFQSADVHIQEVRSNGKSTTKITAFQGRFFEIEFEKKFEFDVYILPNKVRLFKSFYNMAKVDLESINFNQTFDVFSGNQHSAFYLLKPRLMEKMIEFARIGKSVAFTFKDQFVYVAIDTRIDTFDLKMFRPLNDDHLEVVKKEVNMMFELIDLIET
ncbi:MAG: DUF3137 domain-containing protein [Acholeplasmataceae bacterium]